MELGEGGEAGKPLGVDGSQAAAVDEQLVEVGERSEDVRGKVDVGIEAEIE
jgi:hypothetical protein